jgi:putative ABC transport system permease protein
MNPLQFLKFALHGLWRQKVRTALTLVGVTVGTCALAFSVALGLGLRQFIDNEFKGRDDFWRVLVRVDELPPDETGVPPKELEVKGEMSEARRARIREMLLERYQRTRPPRRPKLLTPDNLDAIAKLPGVAEVRTFRTGDGRATGATTVPPVSVVSGPLADLAPRLIAGRLPASPDARELVVSEFTLYLLGFHSDADLARALDTPLELVVGGVKNEPSFAMLRALLGRKPPEELTPEQMKALKKLTDALPKKIDAFDLSAAEKLALAGLLAGHADTDYERPGDSGKTVTDTFRICGVVRVLTHAEKKKNTPLDAWELASGDVFLPPATGDTLFNKLPWVKDRGVFSADVRVTPGADLPAIVSAVEAMGYKTHSGAKWFAAAKREVTLIAAGLNLFALIALFVAAVGITNTLVTSVIERTKEIGILRAVGATRRQIMSLFLLEGALIGALGALMGLALARGLAVWGDDWVRSLIAQQMDGEKMLSTTVFVFPVWLWAGSLAFAVGVTTLAALYPARRAANINPIEALRFG